MQKCLLFATILWPSMSSAEHYNQRTFKDDGQFRKLSDLWKMLLAIDLNLFILKTDAKDLTLPHSLQIRPRAIADWCRILWLWVSNSVRSWGHLFRNTSWCKDALTHSSVMLLTRKSQKSTVCSGEEQLQSLTCRQNPDSVVILAWKEMLIAI